MCYNKYYTALITLPGVSAFISILCLLFVQLVSLYDNVFLEAFMTFKVTKGQI